MEYEIIAAAEEDRAELLSLYKAQLGREYCPWSEEYPSHETITFDLARNALFILKKDGHIAAAISLDADETVDALPCWDAALTPAGELSRLAVLPAEQGKGLARVMLQFGMEELKRRGCRGVHLLVDKRNVKALRSYAVFGFRTVDERFMYGHDYLCYEKEL